MRLAVVALVAACASPAAPRRGRWMETAHISPAAARPPVFPATGPFRLDHAFEPVRYRASLVLEEHAFTGHVEIDGTLSAPRSLIWLHGVGLVVTRAVARQGGREVPLIASGPRDDQLLGLYAKPPLPPGAWTIAIDYRGSIQEQQPPQLTPYGTSGDPPGTGVFRRVVGGDSYFFTQSEAIYARRIFPCIDEPDRKVPWQLTLDVPAGLVAASNTPIVRETPLARGRKRVEFAETKPLPSYLVAFAVGPFDVVDAGKAKSGVPIRILVLKGETGEAATAAAVTPKLLDALEAWTEIPYAYGKLDLVMVPHMGLGAMENPGLVTMDQQAFDGDTPSGIIAHELAHQWFGDLVTPRWWDDIWLNESFAFFVASKLDRLPADDPPDVVQDHATALAFLRPTRWSIRQRIHSSQELELPGFPDEGIDGRGAAVLELLEAELGPEPFRQALHDYLASHAHGTVTTADLVTALDAHAAMPLDAIMGELLDHGAPTLDAWPNCDHGIKLHVVVDAPAIPVCVAYDRDGARAELCTTVGPDSPDVPLPAKACPRWVLPDAGGLGPYRVTWTAPLVHDLLAHGWSALTPTERASLFTEVDDYMLQLEIVAKLDSDGDRLPTNLETRFLEDSAKLVPADVWPRFAARIEARYGALGHRSDLTAGTPTGDEVSAVAMLALVDDARLARAAARVAPHLLEHTSNTRFESYVLELAANQDPALAQELLSRALERDRYHRYGLVEALSSSRGLAQLLAHDPDDVARLGRAGIGVLFSNTCDPAVRAELAALAKSRPSDGFDKGLAIVDSCIAEQASLAAYFRAWLAPRARTSSR